MLGEPRCVATEGTDPSEASIGLLAENHLPRTSDVRARSSCAAQIASRARSQQGSNAYKIGEITPVFDCPCWFTAWLARCTCHRGHYSSSSKITSASSTRNRGARSSSYSLVRRCNYTCNYVHRVRFFKIPSDMISATALPAAGKRHLARPPETPSERPPAALETLFCIPTARNTWPPLRGQFSRAPAPAGVRTRAPLDPPRRARPRRPRLR